MKTKYHIEITQQALGEHFSVHAMRMVIKGNIRQDKILNQFGHDYIHFDGSALKAGFNYISKQKQTVMDAIHVNNFSLAQLALGRITHSWQDFYSHSNYVKLWLAKAGNLPPVEIVISDPQLMNNPELQSGKNYGLIEFFATLPVVAKWLKPKMPADSHARMNLDNPEAGELFAYAYMAALKQTTAIFEQLIGQINQLEQEEQVRSFLGK